MLDRLADWLDTHDRSLRLGAWAFMALGALYVGAHVGI